MTEHSKLPPSRASRRVQCPGSRHLESLMPQTENEYSREGTAAHEVALKLVKDKIISQVGDTTSNGVVVTQEMIDGAFVYEKYLDNYRTPITNTMHFDFETKLSISDVHPDCFGTPDACAYDEFSNSLHIFDYKFGYKFVEEFENWQLLEYAAGYLQKFRSGNTDFTPNSFSLHIIQPRSYSSPKTRCWRLSFSQFQTYLITLKYSEKIASQDNAPLKISKECLYCSAKSICPLLKDTTLLIGDIIKQDNPMNASQILSPTNFELAQKLKFLKENRQILDYEINALEPIIIEKIKQGEIVPYFSLKPSFTREKWKLKELEKLEALAELLNISITVKNHITPKQAIDRGFPESVAKQYCEKSRTGYTLVEENLSEIKNLFSKNT